MKKYLPLFVVVIVLAIVAVVVVQKKAHQHHSSTAKIVQTKRDNGIGGLFRRQRSCGRLPYFLTALKIPQPVMIDLSQKRFKGIALLYGSSFRQVLHPREWEQYAHFGTYAADSYGDIYLVPMPYISIHPKTFDLQKKLYRIDSRTGHLTVWMTIDDIHPSASNPYGLIAIAYDCDDGTLWASAIDESDYTAQKGVIYHIDPRTKKLLQRVEGVDALSLTLLTSRRGKYLLAGSARESVLYAYSVTGKHLDDHPQRVLTLPDPTMRIRKIKIIGENRLELQAIPFSYSLIAQTAAKERVIYDAQWLQDKQSWQIVRRK